MKQLGLHGKLASGTTRASADSPKVRDDCETMPAALTIAAACKNFLQKMDEEVDIPQWPLDMILESSAD